MPRGSSVRAKNSNHVPHNYSAAAVAAAAADVVEDCTGRHWDDVRLYYLIFCTAQMTFNAKYVMHLYSNLSDEMISIKDGKLKCDIHTMQAKNKASVQWSNRVIKTSLDRQRIRIP